MRDAYRAASLSWRTRDGCEWFGLDGGRHCLMRLGPLFTRVRRRASGSMFRRPCLGAVPRRRARRRAAPLTPRRSRFRCGHWGFALRACPSGVRSWPVQLPDRRWVSLGRIDEVLLGDAEPRRKPSERTPRGGPAASGRPGPRQRWEFPRRNLRPHGCGQPTRDAARKVARLRAAFADLLEVALDSITAAKVDRWRADIRQASGDWFDHKLG